MANKFLFSSSGTIKAMAMPDRRANKNSKIITSFGPVLTKGQRFETISVDKNMRKELEIFEPNQFKVVKKAGSFSLVKKSVKRKKNQKAQTR